MFRPREEAERTYDNGISRTFCEVSVVVVNGQSVEVSRHFCGELMVWRLYRVSRLLSLTQVIDKSVVRCECAWRGSSFDVDGTTCGGFAAARTAAQPSERGSEKQLTGRKVGKGILPKNEKKKTTTF